MITFSEFKDLLKHPFNEYKFFYEEMCDVRANLSYDNDWVVTPSTIIHNDKEYNLQQMLMKDPIIKDLLEVFIRKNTFELIFQIPDLHQEDVYPHLDKDQTAIKIICEKVDDKVVFPMISLRDYVYSIEPESIEDLYKTLVKLDAISSGFIGIRFIHYASGHIGEVITDSYKDLHKLLSLPKNYITDDESIEKFSLIFNMIKRQESTMLKEVYPQYSNSVEYVLNTILKPVFEYFMLILDHKVEQDKKNLKPLSRMPESIKQWLSSAIDMTSESDKSNSIILWRELVELDVPFCDIMEAYKVIDIKDIQI